MNKQHMVRGWLLAGIFVFVSAGLGVGQPQAAAVTDMQPDTVIGTDNRTIVQETTSRPFEAVVYVKAYFPKLAANQYNQGTGAMIGPDAVLTAGHVLYDKNYGGMATRVEVIPAYNGGQAPVGVASGRAWYVTSAFKASGAANEDIGLIKLNSTIGQTTGTFGLASGVKKGDELTMAGYPSDKNGRMTEMSSPIQAVAGGIAEYLFDTAPGSSGSPVYNQKNQIEVVHSAGSTSMNQGVALSVAQVKQLLAWRNTPVALPVNQQVRVVKSRYPLWRDLSFKQQVDSTTNRLGTYYLAKQDWFLTNGNHYVSLFNGRGQRVGYVNRAAVTAVTTTSIGRTVTVTTGNYNLWRGFDFSGVVSRSRTWFAAGQPLQATVRYTLASGAQYYSLYDATNTWVGYLRTTAARVLTPVTVGRNEMIKSNRYARYADLLIKKKKGSTAGLAGRTVYVARRYILGNGWQLYSVYTSKNGSWLGYIRAGAF